MTFEKLNKAYRLKISPLVNKAVGASVCTSHTPLERDRPLNAPPVPQGRVLRCTGVGAAIVALVLFAGRPCAVAQEGAFAGVVSDVSCAGQIIEAGTTAVKDLARPRDTHRPVATGDRLRCVNAGQIVVNQGPTRKIITKKDDWVQLRPSPILNAIVQSSDLAGTRAGDEQPIYSPPSGGAARAGDFAIRWNPWPGVRNVTVSVWLKGSRDKLCCDGTLDGTTGSLERPDLCEALAKLRDREPEDRKFVVNITGSPLNDFGVVFSLLSAVEEVQLENELAAWDGRGELLRHLGRAHVFSNYKLFTEAAQESQAALALAPTSPYLLAESINAEDATENAVRVAELKRRLATLGKHH
jgi:hypothetical protein